MTRKEFLEVKIWNSWSGKNEIERLIDNVQKISQNLEQLDEMWEKKSDVPPEGVLKKGTEKKKVIKKKTRKKFPDLKGTSLQIESIPLSIQLDGWNKDSPLDISSFSFKTLKIKRNKNKEGLTTTYRE